MDDQPVGLECRRKGNDLNVIARAGKAQEEKRKTCNEGADEAQIPLDIHREEYAHNDQRSRHRKLVHVCPGHPRGSEAPHNGRGELQEEGQRRQGHGNTRQF